MRPRQRSPRARDPQRARRDPGARAGTSQTAHAARLRTRPEPRCAASTSAAASAFSTTCSRSLAASMSSPTSSRESVQPSVETMLARAPEVILEVRATGLLAPSGRRRGEARLGCARVCSGRAARAHPDPARRPSGRAGPARRAGHGSVRASPSSGRVQMKILPVVELGQGQRVGAAHAESAVSGRRAGAADDGQ